MAGRACMHRLVLRNQDWCWADRSEHLRRWPLRYPCKPTGILRTFLNPPEHSFIPTWYHELLLCLHPSNLRLTEILLEAGIKVAPPFEEHSLADQLEPRCELERLVLEHGLQLLLSNEAAVTDLIRVNVEVDIGLNKEDVVDCGRVSVDRHQKLMVTTEPFELAHSSPCLI